MTELPIQEAIQRLGDFLGAVPLTERLAKLEYELANQDVSGARAAAAQAGVDQDLLRAALVARAALGRINDLVHAAAILTVLPQILEPGEVIVRRPSLAAGNDESRPYDLETDRRVAEFKLAHWTGADAMRKRTTFKDLVHLAANTSGRLTQLYVVGDAPIRFLRKSRANAGWGLSRGPDNMRALFEARFGPLTMPICEFTAGPGAAVEIVDIAPLLDGGTC